MEKIDISKLKRDSNYIRNYIKEKSGVITTSKETKIYFPERFERKELAILGNVCRVIGVVATVIDDRYSLMKIPTKVEFVPAEINQVEINNEIYYEFVFEKDSQFVNNINLIKSADKAYEFFELFIMQGKIPWYVEYMDIIDIFNNFNKYTGMKATENMLIVEILSAVITKVKNELETDYRMKINKLADLKNTNPEFVGLMDVYYSYRSSMSKLLGNYFKKAIDSTILYPEKEISDLENVLRE